MLTRLKERLAARKEAQALADARAVQSHRDHYNYAKMTQAQGFRLIESGILEAQNNFARELKSRVESRAEMTESGATLVIQYGMTSERKFRGYGRVKVISEEKMIFFPVVYAGKMVDSHLRADVFRALADNPEIDSVRVER